MQLPLQISFHNMPHSAEVEETIRRYAAALDEYCSRIMSCRVVVDQPHKHHEQGNLYQVRIDIKVPGGEIAVSREPSQHTAYKDLETVIGDAFDLAVRQLEDYVRQERRDVKQHALLPHARIARLALDDGYGFLATADGREIYFHQNSLLDADFRRLKVGDEVTFVEQPGEQGPQASTVKLVGRHSHV